jgi:hypothetical protein
MKFKTYKIARRSTGIYIEAAVLDRVSELAKENALTANEILCQLIKVGLAQAESENDEE